MLVAGGSSAWLGQVGGSGPVYLAPDPGSSRHHDEGLQRKWSGGVLSPAQPSPAQHCSLLALVLQYIAVLPILSVPRVCLCCKDHKLFINCLLVLLAITSIDVLTDQLSNAPNTPFLLELRDKFIISLKLFKNWALV